MKLEAIDTARCFWLFAFHVELLELIHIVIEALLGRYMSKSN